MPPKPPEVPVQEENSGLKYIKEGASKGLPFFIFKRATVHHMKITFMTTIQTEAIVSVIWFLRLLPSGRIYISLCVKLLLISI
jgi:hypothetical protein